MKKLIVFLSLFSLVNIQAANSDAFEAARLAMDAQDGAPAALEQEVHQVAPQDGERIPVALRVNDGTELYIIPDVRVFETLANMVQDVELAPGEFIIEVPVANEALNQFSLDVIHDLYFNPDFVLPITPDEWAAKRTNVKDVLHGLNFLDAQDWLKIFYRAWLNHPVNSEAVVYHNALGQDIFNQMGLGEFQGLAYEHIKALKISVNANDIVNIHNYHNRPRTVGYLQATGQIPAVVNGSLDLSNKQITTLCKNDFVGIPGITTVTELDLSENEIASIESGAFTGLAALTELHLYGNQISEIEPGIFTGLTGLTYLALDLNQITSIQPGAFTGLVALTELDLSGNEITRIEPGIFNGLTVLTELDLSENQIESLREEIFIALARLTYLNLKNNSIYAIETEAFKGLDALTELDISGNQIDETDLEAFEGLNALTHLNLSRNHIRRIEAGMFIGFTALTHLNLSECSLARIEAGAFSDFTALTHLNLLANLIDEVDSEAFEGLDALIDLDLRGNMISIAYHSDIQQQVPNAVVSL